MMIRKITTPTELQIKTYFRLWLDERSYKNQMKRSRSFDEDLRLDTPTIDASALHVRMKEIYTECLSLREKFFEDRADGKWFYQNNQRFMKVKEYENIQRAADEYYQNLLMERVHLIPKEMVVIGDVGVGTDTDI